MQNLIESPFYQSLFKSRLSGRSISELTTSAGGKFLSTSIGGAITGRGADRIIIDDPLKASEALSEPRRTSVNDIYDNTVRSRLNSQEHGAIIIVAQRLHCDDLVAHVQAHEKWDVLSFPAIAEHDEVYSFQTPYGGRHVTRKEGEALHPAHLSQNRIDELRGDMTEYNFAAQFQQDPQPASGLLVQREWLTFYTPAEKPTRAECSQVIQSWDTASKETELANYSVCTTWGLRNEVAYLLDVFRQKLNFPTLVQAVKEQAALHQASTVLIEDQSSGIALLHQLKADGFYKAQAVSVGGENKVMRLLVETAKIKSGLARFPTAAAWLDMFLTELLAFPNSKNDDQVDSLVMALAWMTQNQDPGWILYAKRELNEQKARSARKLKTIRVQVPPGQYQLGATASEPYQRNVDVGPDGILEGTEEELIGLLINQTAKRLD